MFIVAVSDEDNGSFESYHNEKATKTVAMKEDVEPVYNSKEDPRNPLVSLNYAADILCK